MTTEELENKLKITKDTCIYCQTLELAKQVLSIFDQLGLEWRDKTSYILYTNWDSFKENTVYSPFDGQVSPLGFASFTGCEIIHAEDFIALHTKEKEFKLETYEPKGELTGFPKEIIARMLDCQEEQGNPRNISVFERNIYSNLEQGGFDWGTTIEKGIFWSGIISAKNLNLFFKKYQKRDIQQDNSQEFRVGDKVIDIISGQIGKVTKIDTLNNDSYSILVDFNNNEIVRFTLDGRYYGIDKYPRLLHYRDDYDYLVIDFNNLPKRQKPKRWRGEVTEKYYYLSMYLEVRSLSEDYSDISTKLYNLGNYFKTEEEAQNAADKLKEYFKQLIKI